MRSRAACGCRWRPRARRGSAQRIEVAQGHDLVAEREQALGLEPPQRRVEPRARHVAVERELGLRHLQLERARRKARGTEERGQALRDLGDRVERAVRQRDGHRLREPFAQQLQHEAVEGAVAVEQVEEGRLRHLDDHRVGQRHRIAEARLVADQLDLADPAEGLAHEGHGLARSRGGAQLHAAAPHADPVLGRIAAVPDGLACGEFDEAQLRQQHFGLVVAQRVGPDAAAPARLERGDLAGVHAAQAASVSWYSPTGTQLQNRLRSP